MAELREPAAIAERLARARTIAVLGASAKPGRPAHYVPAYLAAQGYRILPVNPVYAGEVLFGSPVRSSLREIDEPVDILDVFRRAEDLPAHLPEILAMRPLPGLVWFQLGIQNDAVARALGEAGIDVVQDRCTLADHRAFGLSPRR
ncbi:MAG: CoA-binding protein [Deltaproteobacteria bacterium]|nr:MAG: CoA-binding protein [Deltaproteobacteria bacterium]